MARSARSEKSRFSAGGPVSYLSHYLLDFYITVSIFILHNLLLLDSIFFLLDSKSTFIRRSRAKHFGYPPFFDHKSATKPLQSHKLNIKKRIGWIQTVQKIRLVNQRKKVLDFYKIIHIFSTTIKLLRPTILTFLLLRQSNERIIFFPCHH